MTEGTKSYLIGCHQFLIHPLWVLIAWRLVNKGWPRWWELICIFLHDIGICGRNYLSDDNAKNGHWKRGAKWSLLIIDYLDHIPYSVRGLQAYRLCAGHTMESDFPSSRLLRADKMARVVMPTWMMWLEYWFEIKKTGGLSPPKWKKELRGKLALNEPFHAHELYQRTRRRK